MTVLIRCNYCKKTVPYYGKLYRVLRVGGVKGWHYDDNFRYCSKECADKQIEKEKSNEQKS